MRSDDEIKKWDRYPDSNQARPVLFSIQTPMAIQALLNHFPTVYDFVLIDEDLPENMHPGKIYLSIEKKCYWALDINDSVITDTFGDEIDFSSYDSLKDEIGPVEFNTNIFSSRIRTDILRRMKGKSDFRIEQQRQINKYIATSAIWSGKRDYCTPTSHYAPAGGQTQGLGIVLNPDQLRLGQADFCALNSGNVHSTEVSRASWPPKQKQQQKGSFESYILSSDYKYPAKVVYPRDHKPVTHHGLSEKIPNDKGGYDLVLHTTPSFDVFFRNVWRKYWKRNKYSYNEALVCQKGLINPIDGLMMSDSVSASQATLNSFCNLLESNSHLKLYLYNEDSREDNMRYIEDRQVIKDFIARVRALPLPSNIGSVFNEFYTNALSCLIAVPDLQHQDAIDPNLQCSSDVINDANHNPASLEEHEPSKSSDTPRTCYSFLVDLLSAIAAAWVRLFQTIFPTSETSRPQMF